MPKLLRLYWKFHLICNTEPIYTKYVAEEIARIKEISVEEVIKVTTENAKRIYVMK